jgi:hypothetical protein
MQDIEDFVQAGLGIEEYVRDWNMAALIDPSSPPPAS